MSKDQYSPIRPFNLNDDLRAPSPIQSTNLADFFGTPAPQSTNHNGGSLTIGNTNVPSIPFPELPGLPTNPSNLINMPTGSVLGTIFAHSPSIIIAHGAPLQAASAPFTIGSLEYSPSVSINTPSSPFALLSVVANLDEDLKSPSGDESSDAGSTSGDNLSDEECNFLQQIDFISSTPQAKAKRERDSEDSDEPDAKTKKLDATPENTTEPLQLGHFTHLLSPINLSDQINSNVFDDLELTSDEDDDTVVTPTVLNTAFIQDSDDDASSESFLLFSKEELAELSGSDSLEGLNP